MIQTDWNNLEVEIAEQSFGGVCWSHIMDQKRVAFLRFASDKERIPNHAAKRATIQVTCLTSLNIINHCAVGYLAFATDVSDHQQSFGRAQNLADNQRVRKSNGLFLMESIHIQFADRCNVFDSRPIDQNVAIVQSENRYKRLFNALWYNQTAFQLQQARESEMKSFEREVEKLAPQIKHRLRDLHFPCASLICKPWSDSIGWWSRSIQAAKMAQGQEEGHKGDELKKTVWTTSLCTKRAINNEQRKEPARGDTTQPKISHMLIHCSVLTFTWSIKRKALKKRKNEKWVKEGIHENEQTHNMHKQKKWVHTQPYRFDWGSLRFAFHALSLWIHSSTFISHCLGLCFHCKHCVNCCNLFKSAPFHYVAYSRSSLLSLVASPSRAFRALCVLLMEEKKDLACCDFCSFFLCRRRLHCSHKHGELEHGHIRIGIVDGFVAQTATRRTRSFCLKWRASWASKDYHRICTRFAYFVTESSYYL